MERDRARAFLELHDSILLEIDAARRVREINARGSELLGAPVPEILGRDWLDFIHGDSERERARTMLASALASGSRANASTTALDMTGERRRVYWRCVARRAADGSPAGWLCSGVDVTDRAAREAHARVAQDRLTRVARLATVGELAAGVAHEINQPLTAITTYARACARYLEMPQPDFDEIREAVREIGTEGLRAGEIIRRLRRMARTTRVTSARHWRSTRSSRNCARCCSPMRACTTCALGFKLGGGLPPVLANGTQLQQVVLNLVRNAFEALGRDSGRLAHRRDRHGAHRGWRGRNQRHRQWPRHRGQRGGQTI